MDFFLINEQKLASRFRPPEHEKKREHICKLFEELYKYVKDNVKDERVRSEINEYIVEGYYMGKRMSDKLQMIKGK